LKRPSPLTVVLAVVPFVATCFTVSLWDRVDPMIFGLPFNMAWLVAWLVLTPGLMAIAYRIERRR
jgi:hypothetical protein